MRPPAELKAAFDALTDERQAQISRGGGDFSWWEAAIRYEAHLHQRKPPELVATPCSEIQEQRVEWLWRGRIPRGALTLLEGPPKAGKSTVLADLAARVSSGREMPDGQPCEKPGVVLMLSDEDSPAHVIVPRLRVAGARLDAVRIVKMSREGRPRQFVIGPEDIAYLERTISDTGAASLIIDPLSIYMGSIDAHREQDVRQTLWHLSELAERTGISIVACRHWKKARTGDALAQGGGSVGYSAAARSILSVDRDPDDKSARVLAVGYSNYATDYPSLAFRLESKAGEDVATIRWGGVSKHDADSLASVRLTGEDRGKLSEAEAFLDELLRDGRLPAKDVYAGAEANSIARDTLRRARVTRGVKVTKDGLKGGWYWSLTPEGTEHAGIRTFDTGAVSIRTFEDTEPPHGDAWEPEEGGQP